MLTSGHLGPTQHHLDMFPRVTGEHEEVVTRLKVGIVVLRVSPQLHVKVLGPKRKSSLSYYYFSFLNCFFFLVYIMKYHRNNP